MCVCAFLCLLRQWVEPIGTVVEVDVCSMHACICCYPCTYAVTLFSLLFHTLHTFVFCPILSSLLLTFFYFFIFLPSSILPSPPPHTPTIQPSATLCPTTLSTVCLFHLPATTNPSSIPLFTLGVCSLSSYNSPCFSSLSYSFFAIS